MAYFPLAALQQLRDSEAAAAPEDDVAVANAHRKVEIAAAVVFEGAAGRMGENG